MMIRSNRNRKFSVKYRIEKWFYEDSKADIKKAVLFIIEGLSGLLMFAALAIIPALFH
jgi:ferredoxin-fold anticodon binding domain-containing protein